LLYRYFIFLSYRGTQYHGWQAQPNSVTVQKLLDKALSTILSEQINTTGAGRTDAGVHALLFCAHFDSKSDNLATIKNIVYKLNGFLPHDISVKQIRMVKSDANARFSAISRTYKYFISRQKNPFSLDSAWFINSDLSVCKMNEAAELLYSCNEYTSFSKVHSDNKTDICKVSYAKWDEIDDKLVFTITADRFLRNMVRAIVGTHVDIGTGKINIGDFKEIIMARDRSRAGKSAPAKGLFLSGIVYPEDIFI
jgi:tRNA pseudouridine38-40 synthase